MSEMERLTQALENIEIDVNKPGSFEAFILEASIPNLMTSNLSTSEKPHEDFLEVCRHGIRALEGYENNLVESPAAPILLEYLLFAFQRYQFSMDNAKIKPDQNCRREFLAKAFGTVGRSGRSVTTEQMMIIGEAFSGAMYGVICTGSEPTPKDFTCAARVAYRAHYKKEWKRDDEGAKKGMTAIRAILRDGGYL